MLNAAEKQQIRTIAPRLYTPLHGQPEFSEKSPKRDLTLLLRDLGLCCQGSDTALTVRPKTLAVSRLPMDRQPFAIATAGGFATTETKHLWCS